MSYVKEGAENVTALAWERGERTYTVECTCGHSAVFPYGYDPALIGGNNYRTPRDRGNRGMQQAKAMRDFKTHVDEHLKPGAAAANAAMIRNANRPIRRTRVADSQTWDEANNR